MVHLLLSAVLSNASGCSSGSGATVTSSSSECGDVSGDAEADDVPDADTDPDADLESGHTGDTALPTGDGCVPAPWTATATTEMPPSGTELTSHIRFQFCVDPAAQALTGRVQLTFEDGADVVCDQTNVIDVAIPTEAADSSIDLAWDVTFMFPVEVGTTLCLPLGLGPIQVDYDDFAVSLSAYNGWVWTYHDRLNGGWGEIGFDYISPWTMTELVDGRWSIEGTVERSSYVLP